MLVISSVSYSDEEKKKISAIVYQKVKKSIEPLKRKEYDNGMSSFVFKYMNLTLEVYCNSTDKNKLINRVIKEITDPQSMKIFRKMAIKNA